MVLSPSGHPLAYGVLRILTPGRAMKEPTSGSRVDTGTCVLYRQILVLIKKNFFFLFSHEYVWNKLASFIESRVFFESRVFIWDHLDGWVVWFYSVAEVQRLDWSDAAGGKSVTCIFDWGWFNWTVKPLQVRDRHIWHMCSFGTCAVFCVFKWMCVKIPASSIAKCESVGHSVVCDSLHPLWTGACQSPLSMGFPRQGYWSGLPFPPPGDLPDQVIILWSTCIAGRLFTFRPPGKPTFFFWKWKL